MMNTMTYKGYAAKIDYSDEDLCFVGRVAGIRDVIGFHADNVTDLRTAFEEAVDDYIAYCAEQGREPLRSASGKISLRISPEVHSAINVAAEVSGKSVNQWINDTLSRAAHGQQELGDPQRRFAAFNQGQRAAHVFCRRQLRRQGFPGSQLLQRLFRIDASRHVFRVTYGQAAAL